MSATVEAPPPAPSEPNPYDVVPYDSYCFDFTLPDRMHAIGRLFGLTPPDFHKARVLELGCAGGGNLVPMAVRYPQARFVGIDLSAVEIDHARQLAEDAGAENIAFHRMSIADIGPELGLFDYIVVHGVFSWVPAPVREAIVRVSKENLAPDGIALVSYNTLPGWNQVRAVRDMMLYHCARFPTLQEKIGQGIALLKFVLESANPNLKSYRESLQSELDLLSSQRAYYIFHEHLENENFSLHLHEMADMARARGLEYLSDVNLEIMFLQNFPENVARLLGAAEDIVRIEQYLDFITNRRFRVSLFCHRGLALQRNLQSAQIFDFHLGSRVLPPVEAPDLRRDARTVFRMQNGAEMTAELRHTLAVLLVLSEFSGRIVEPAVVVREAAGRLGGGPDAEARVRQALEEIGLRLVFSGGLVLHSDAPRVAAAVSESPTAFAAARAASKRWDIVPSVFHQRITMGPADRTLLQLCDGTRDLDALVAGIGGKLETGELTMNRDGKPIADLAAARGDLETWVKDMLGQFARLGLLVA